MVAYATRHQKKKTGIVTDGCGVQHLPLKKCLKLVGGKHPDRLADPCKHLSINWMAASERLSKCNHEFFLLSASFSNIFFIFKFKQAVGPSVIAIYLQP